MLISYHERGLIRTWMNSQTPPLKLTLIEQEILELIFMECPLSTIRRNLIFLEPDDFRKAYTSVQKKLKQCK